MDATGLSIFLSHSVSDGDRALLSKIDSECRSLNISVYIAEREFSPTTVTDKLRRAIASADAFVVLLTSSGASSAWVNTEVGIALEQDKPIIPIVEEGVAPQGPIRERDQIRFTRGRIDDAIRRTTQFLQTLSQSGKSGEEPREGTGPDFATGFVIGAAVTVLIVLVIVALASRE